MNGIASGEQTRADWLIDLGPEAWPGLDPGAATRASLRSPRTKMSGGEIVAAGAPEEGVKAGRSYTGRFLKPGWGGGRAGGSDRPKQRSEVL
jgi:hypothetical protein